MSENSIQPQNITKPFQLLAAWIVGLVLSEGIVLRAAVSMEPGSLERSLLVGAGVGFFPLFLVVWAFLQTKFRAELQDDMHYSDYISKKSNSTVSLTRLDTVEALIESSLRSIEVRLDTLGSRTPSLNKPATVSWAQWKVAINVKHPQYSAIRNALKSARIPLALVFGKSTSDVPAKWLIAIHENMPLENKFLLLRELSRFEFSGFQFWIPRPEIDETEDVYIGSYGIDEFMPFSSELRSQLEGEFDEFAFGQSLLISES
ncbi:hypothetical protein AB7828_02055 [Tardiphaga sp. 215_C5_N2_1]|uniref:hypothetical protein n=1 Tax=Tardiphaga sp. 215_C5_N2_1 TaxID=3240774 RepID=UPI003F89FC42